MERGGATKKQRRALLDAAAWARDVIYVLAGFAAGATKASAAAPMRPSRPPLDPDAYESQAAFKRAVAQAAWAERHLAFQRFSDLRIVPLVWPSGFFRIFFGRATLLKLRWPTRWMGTPSMWGRCSRRCRLT